MVLIRFTNFWENSEHSKETFFIPLLESVFQDKARVVYDPEVRVDLEVESVFKPKVNPVMRKMKSVLNFDAPDRGKDDVKKTGTSQRKIWYSGENRRPPLFQEFNSYLCFDDNSLARNVHYLPLWVLNIDWFRKSRIGGRISVMPEIEPLMHARSFGSKLRHNSQFCCAFIGIAENMRLNAIKELSLIDEIEIFGRTVNRQVPDKIEAAKRFKFVLAFENTLYPGYVTEKLIEAYLANTIPIYWGIDKFEYFNANAFINLNDFDSMSGFVEEVRNVNSSVELYQYFFEQSLFKKRYDLDELINRLREDLL